MGELIKVTNPDVKLIFDVLKQKHILYDLLEKYYTGRQPLVYLTEKLRDVFSSIDARFTQNWCAVVIDACKERINMRGFSVTDETAAKTLNDLFQANDGTLESDDVHLYSLIFGESFVIAEQDDETNEVLWYYNDPRLVHVVYDANKPRVKRVAGKLWVADDKTYRLTLYYIDHFEHYYTTKKADAVTDSTSFLPDMDEGDNWPANEYPAIPVFHFRIARSPISDLSNVIEPQNGINKLLADMMVAAEFGAFRQRYIISGSETQAKLDSEPGGLWVVPGSAEGEQETKVGEFEASDLDNYLKAIDKLASAIAIISRTPKHYLFSESGTPSGEALIAMEAPLNKKAQDRIDRFIPEWRRLGKFLLELTGIMVNLADIEPNFDLPETVQPEMEATITKNRVESGVPLEVALDWEGRTDDEIEAVKKVLDEADKKESARRERDLASAALAFERGTVSNVSPSAVKVSNPADARE